MDGRMDWCIDALLKVCVYFWNTGNKQGEMPAAFISPTLPPNLHAETNRRRHLHAANSHTPWNEILTFSSTFWQYPRRGALMKIPSNRCITFVRCITCVDKKNQSSFFPLVPECSILVSHNKIYQSSISVSRTMRTRGPTNWAGMYSYTWDGDTQKTTLHRGETKSVSCREKVVQNEAKFKWKRRIISMHHNQPQGGTLRLPSRRKHFLFHWNKCSLCCCSLKSPPCHLFVFGCNSSLPTSPSIVCALVSCVLLCPDWV